MGRLSSSIGLITGTDIVGTVDKLIALSAQPRDRLVARTDKLREQQTAMADVTALVIGVELSAKRLGQPTQFQARTATSSLSDAISVTASAAAEVGSFKAQSLQVAKLHTAQSSFQASSATAAVGQAGQITIRGGGQLAHSASLDSLNQGRGVQAGSIRISDRSGQSAEIDLSQAKNIDDVINTINQTSGLGIRATTVGDQIRLTDTTGSTSHNLRVDEVGGGETAADLGLRGINIASNVALGHDIYGAIGEADARGLQGVLLSELDGGQGLGNLTEITVTTSDGASGSIDLSSAKTTHDIQRLINDSGLAVEARLNSSGTGLRIRDLSGGNTAEMTITSADQTASRLGIAGTAQGRVIEGSDLGRPAIGRDTALSSLRQGKGISAGSFTITDTFGRSAEIDLADADSLSVGDLIDRINAAGLSVQASIDGAGDTIQLSDSGNGGSRMKVVGDGTSQTAADLGLMGSVRTQISPSGATQTLSTPQRNSITVLESDSLESIAKKINASSPLANASVVQDSDGNYRLSIRSNRSGDAGQLSISSNNSQLQFATTAIGQDAVIALTHGGVTQQVRSADGVFTDIRPGVSLTVKDVSASDATIQVNRNSEGAMANAKLFVEQFNKLTDKLKELTAYNLDTHTGGVLYGSSEVMRIESTLRRLTSGRVNGAGALSGFNELGIRTTAEGKMELDEGRLSKLMETRADDVEAFFTTESTGVVARLTAATDRIAGVKNSILINRSESLGVQILRNEERTESMQGRLNSERERLLRQFIAAEEAIAKLQNNQSAISQIRYIGNDQY